MTDQRLDLGVLYLRIVDHDQAAVLGLRRQGMLERQRAHLLRQVGRVRANHRTECTAAAAELRHAGRAVTRTAGALLLVHLLAGAPDVGATLGLVGAGLPLGELPVDAALDQILARLKTENLVRELDRAGVLAFKRGD